MNRISAKVTAIESVESVSIVAFEAAGQPMRMMSLELDGTLAPGAAVTLGVKASSIALAKAFEGELSISNRLEMTVESVTEGQLLCSVKLRFGGALLESIITRESAQRLHLQVGDTVTALIKASDVSILETVR
jgi:molybdate transport system regulatory protein